MRNFRHLVFLFAFFTLSLLQAQQDSIAPIVRPASIAESDFEAIKTIEDTLGVLGFLVVNDSMPDYRFAACQKLIPKLVEALKYPNSFDYKFDRLNSISIQYPPDSTFRIFTWQLYVDVDEYHYYGAIQMNSPDLKLFPLIDRSEKVEFVETDILSPQKWYGAVYYNLMPFKTPSGTKYLLFGYDGFQFFNKRKVIDVLHFVDNKPVFGAPVFVRSEESKNHPPTKNRVVKEYYAGTVFSMNYDEVHEVILFDHLEAQVTKDGIRSYPDGTYEAYELKKGQWVHVEKMFHEILEEAPREEPVFDATIQRKERKNIFGQE